MRKRVVCRSCFAPIRERTQKLQPECPDLNPMGMRSQRVVLYAFLAWLAWAGTGRLFAQERIFWFSNYDEAIQEAKNTQKPIFLEIRCEA